MPGPNVRVRCGPLFASPVDLVPIADLLAIPPSPSPRRQVWGVVIGSTVLQNELGKRLPPPFLAQFPEGLEIVYAVIPTIPSIQDPVFKLEIQTAFAESLQLLWKVCVPISGLGLLVSLAMKEIPMHAKVDEAWAYDMRRGADGASSEEEGRMMASQSGELGYEAGKRLEMHRMESDGKSSVAVDGAEERERTVTAESGSTALATPATAYKEAMEDEPRRKE